MSNARRSHLVSKQFPISVQIAAEPWKWACSADSFTLLPMFHQTIRPKVLLLTWSRQSLPSKWYPISIGHSLRTIASTSAMGGKMAVKTILSAATIHSALQSTNFGAWQENIQSLNVVDQIRECRVHEYVNNYTVPV